MVGKKDSAFLVDLQKRIEKAKEELAGIEAEKKVILRQLRETYKCNSIEEAEKKIKELEKKVDKQTKAVDQLVEQIKEKYDVITDTEERT